MAVDLKMIYLDEIDVPLNKEDKIPSLRNENVDREYKIQMVIWDCSMFYKCLKWNKDCCTNILSPNCVHGNLFAFTTDNFKVRW